MMTAACATVAPHASFELIWASPRELLNIIQADAGIIRGQRLPQPVANDL